MKIIMIVLDGAGDLPDSSGSTPISLAKKPGIDSLARKGQAGLLDMGYKGRNEDVNSDMGYLVLLGCYSKEDYPGRGYIEALGAGLEPGPDDIAIRGNFATLDARGNIRDRRAGRDETGLEELAEKLDGMEIDGVHFQVRKSSGHRVCILMKGKNLSDNIMPNDTQRVNVPLPQIKPKGIEAKFTASVLNKFIYRANKILSEDPVNRKRKMPANTILIRNAGRRVAVKSFGERFGLRACSVSGLAVVKGVCRFLNIDNIDVPGATGLPDTDLKAKADAVIENIKNYDFVFLHINGMDTLSHERNPEGKKKFLEKIDRIVLSELIKEIKPRENIYIITCDHRSASSPSYRGYEHLTLPVPALVSGNGIKPSGLKTWNENACEEGFHISGNDLMPWILKTFK